MLYHFLSYITVGFLFDLVMLYIEYKVETRRRELFGVRLNAEANISYYLLVLSRHKKMEIFLVLLFYMIFWPLVSIVYLSILASSLRKVNQETG